MNTEKTKRKQNGSTLLEALAAILIFSIGLVGLLGIQMASVKNSIDAKYRSDASYLANQIVGQMWVDRSNIDNYAYNDSGALCGATTSGSTGNTNVTNWLSNVAATLPGTANAKSQISISTPIASTKLVKVTICWQAPQDTAAHNFALTAQINQ
jgi:type IV pilus assembly protein PilV